MFFVLSGTQCVNVTQRRSSNEKKELEKKELDKKEHTGLITYSPFYQAMPPERVQPLRDKGCLSVRELLTPKANLQVNFVADRSLC
jgi:hypothetical protein